MGNTHIPGYKYRLHKPPSNAILHVLGHSGPHPKERQLAEQKPLTILDVEFLVSQPYETGHPLTEAEAKALNQVRKENLGNNFRKTVQAAIDAAGEGGSVDEATLKEAFAKLDAEYEFTLASVAASRKLDPVEREVRKLIKDALRQQMAEMDPPKKLSELPDDELEAIIDANMDNADIVKLAKKTVADRQKVAGFSLKTAADAAPTEATA